MKKNLYALSVASLLFLSGCKWFSCCSHDHSGPSHTAQEAHNHVKALDANASFADTVLKATKPVVVDFGAPWCGACQEIKPKVHHLAADAAFKDSVIFIEVNVDDHGALAEEYKIQGIPAILFFHNGKEVAQRIVGDVSQATLRTAIESAFKK